MPGSEGPGRRIRLLRGPPHIEAHHRRRRTRRRVVQFHIPPRPMRRRRIIGQQLAITVRRAAVVGRPVEIVAQILKSVPLRQPHLPPVSRLHRTPATVTARPRHRHAQVRIAVKRELRGGVTVRFGVVDRVTRSVGRRVSQHPRDQHHLPVGQAAGSRRRDHHRRGGGRPGHLQRRLISANRIGVPRAVHRVEAPPARRIRRQLRVNGQIIRKLHVGVFIDQHRFGVRVQGHNHRVVAHPRRVDQNVPGPILRPVEGVGQVHHRLQRTLVDHRRRVAKRREHRRIRRLAHVPVVAHTLRVKLIGRCSRSRPSASGSPNTLDRRQIERSRVGSRGNDAHSRQPVGDLVVVAHRIEAHRIHGRCRRGASRQQRPGVIGIGRQTAPHRDAAVHRGCVRTGRHPLVRNLRAQGPQHACGRQRRLPSVITEFNRLVRPRDSE